MPTIDIPDHIYQQLTAQAGHHGVSLSDWLARCAASEQQSALLTQSVAFQQIADRLPYMLYTANLNDQHLEFITNHFATTFYGVSSTEFSSRSWHIYWVS